jgi:uncharacterized protein (TIGR02453 family)
MPAAKPIITREIFQFFKDLGRNNRKVWMDANRERYQSAVVQPLRQLLEEVAPAVLQMDSRFEATGRSGANFSRINRDIRFAKDKTPYRTQMYMKFAVPISGDSESGELYTGFSANTVTAGFRIYGGPKRKDSLLAQVAEPRTVENPRWIAQQKRRLGRRYESYWYSTVKGEWTKHDGWPSSPEDWKKIQGWVVRRKLTPGIAKSASFSRDLTKVFRDLYPLVKFTSLQD